MRRKAENSVSKNKILLEAFKLFASKPFEKVTFADLEKTTGLSRGAILYHIQTKENLFEMVLENLIFKRSTIVSNDNIVGLWNHIEDFIQKRIEEQEDFSSSAIANVNKAFFNIECSAFSYSDKMADFALSWVEKELANWIKLLNDAIAAKEIKSDKVPKFRNKHIPYKLPSIRPQSPQSALKTDRPLRRKTDIPS